MASSLSLKEGRSSSTSDETVNSGSSSSSAGTGILDKIEPKHTNVDMVKHIEGIMSSSSSSSPSFPRKVGIYFYLWRVHEIDTVQQRFSVSVTLSFTWVEDDPKKNIRVNKKQFQRSKAGNRWQLKDDNDTRWQLKDFAWHPQILVRNILQQDDLLTEDWIRVRPSNSSSGSKNQGLSEGNISKETWYNDYSNPDQPNPDQPNSDQPNSDQPNSDQPNSDQPMQITQFMKRKFTLSQAFELHKFPVDLQSLHVQLGSSWDCTKVVLNFNHDVPSAMDPNALDSQEWKLHSPRLIAYDKKLRKDDLPLLSLSSQSVTSAVYPKAYIALTASRKPQFYLWNIYFILLLLGTLSFTVFNIEPEEMEDRLSNMLTLVLALVAFKLVLAQSLPSISYLTMLDVFTLGSMVLMFFVSVATSILPSLGLGQDAIVTLDFTILIISAIAWVALNLWFVATVFLSRRARNAKIKSIDASFESQNEPEALEH